MIAILLLGLLSLACEAEQVGEDTYQVEVPSEEAEAAAAEAARETETALEAAGEAVEGAAREAGQETGEAMSEAGRDLQEASDPDEPPRDGTY